MKTFKEYLTPVAILILAGVLVFDRVGPRPGPAPAPTINGAALGKAYAPVLASSYADAWLAAAKTIEDGKTIAEAQKVLQDTWKDARTRAFTAEVSPGFSVVLPEGTEPTTPDKRAQVADLWKSFARGLKGSMTAMAESYDSLTAKLAPQLQEIIRAQRDSIVANAGGLARREAVRLAFPTFVAEIPLFLRAAVELISREFGHMNLNDLLDFLENHAK